MLLLVDNYDSFTFNLYQMIGALYPRIEVVRNDRITLDEVEAAGVDDLDELLGDDDNDDLDALMAAKPPKKGTESPGKAKKKRSLFDDDDDSAPAAGSVDVDARRGRRKCRQCSARDDAESARSPWQKASFRGTLHRSCRGGVRIPDGGCTASRENRNQTPPTAAFGAKETRGQLVFLQQIIRKIMFFSSLSLGIGFA